MSYYENDWDPRGFEDRPQEIDRINRAVQGRQDELSAESGLPGASTPPLEDLLAKAKALFQETTGVQGGLWMVPHAAMRDLIVAIERIDPGAFDPDEQGDP